MPHRLFGFLLAFAIVGSAFSGVFLAASGQDSQKTDVFVGIDVAYGNLDGVKTLVDRVCGYTNLFVLGCTGITHDATKLDEACQYLYDRGMYFIVYQEWPLGYSRNSNSSINWPEQAKNRWGKQFLGTYYLDESGGRQLDQVREWVLVSSADNYSDASRIFDTKIDFSVNWFRKSYSNTTVFPVFTSDYGLYWFDYKGGYDVLLAQFGWNYSRQLNVALCRGAATMQNKDWGVMITWTYDAPPYIESGEELYKDLVLAYENGAKYIVIFDSNKEYTQGTLREEHFDALKQFWQYAQDNPRKTKPAQDRIAYALPKDYAYGFRGPEDKIWGLWQADNISLHLSKTINQLLEEAETDLDIVYDEETLTGNFSMFKQVLRWDVYGLSSSITLPSPFPILAPTATSPHRYRPTPNPPNSALPTQPFTNSISPQASTSVSPQQKGAPFMFDGFLMVAAAVLVFSAAAIVGVKRLRKTPPE